MKKFKEYAVSHLMLMSGFLAAMLCGLLYITLGQAESFNLFHIFDLAALLGAMVLGWFAGTMALYHVLWQLLLTRRYRNGRDIDMNTRVRVLCGPYRNTVTTVYETWDFRGQVRLELGPDIKEVFGDVFYNYQVERAD